MSIIISAAPVIVLVNILFFIEYFFKIIQLAGNIELFDFV